ncbi:hypothetical protein GGR52DRAFT_591328 [Hypoxylon sp. FL1284]|nr:hypothetical protein GGR52DRAFT_591328 [Hypoxylon sp. FL1284]
MDLLQAVFNHLVLPPQVPGGQDADIEGLSSNVLARMTHACEAAESLVDSPWSKAFQSVRASLEACRALNSGCLEKSTLCYYFRHLQADQVLILHVVEQNAAVLIRREDSDNEPYVLFESFETSAASTDILAAGSALQWDFPGRSARLPLATFNDEPFRECLAAFLEQASMESLYNLQASASKANVSVTEVRDTTDPALITQMLMPLLEAMGSCFEAPVLRKRVRDEVNLVDENLPWRRLPFWLVLRVASQRQLCLTLGNEPGRLAYKFLLCLVLSELLQESAGKLSPDLVIALRAKLCRRMAKLEMERGMAESANADFYAPLFHRICPGIRKTIREATIKVETAGAYLDNLLNDRPQRPRDSTSLDLPQPLDNALQKSHVFTDHVFRLAAAEAHVHWDKEENTSRSPESRCIGFAKEIDDILFNAERKYASDPEQLSAMILALFTLWTRLDKCAIEACPLLADHQPVFSPELLDVLQLPSLSDMRRLQDIQEYLAQRRSRCRYGTVFDQANKNCLAVRYVAQSPEMQVLGAYIQKASDDARLAKEEEWKSTCSDVRGCSRCYHWRTRNRIGIKAHEALLPAATPAKEALLFQLGIPEFLSAYRDATWQICALAYPSKPVATSKPEIELADCTPLRPYIASYNPNVSLASAVKCFSQTHYKFTHGKVALSSVVLPLGANFKLYDRSSKLWIKDFDRPFTFQHLCGITLPHGLAGTVLPPAQHPPPTVDGPTSYEIQVNQTECPSHMSLHEFSALQKLLSGQSRRWLDIIVEIGSSNLNFGSGETTRVLCQLAVQAGPPLPDEVLRTAHVIFKEPDFAQRLADVVGQRLRAVLTNWRERHTMELLITLALRLFSLSSGTSRDRAEALLRSARDATLQWIICLQGELRMTADAAAAQRIAMYGFCAALLCRRTFAIYNENNQRVSAEDLSAWVQASIALQENLVVDLPKLPPNMRSMYIRDAKMAYHLQPHLEVAIQSHPASIGDGISKAWSNTSDSSTVAFSAWKFLSSPQNRWIVAHASGSREIYSTTQTVHFNIIEGYLLVDGRPCRKLPSEIRDSPAIQEMFGHQHLLTYPSRLLGMTHRLSNLVHGQEVHFGLRNGQAIVRVLNRERHLLELIPKGTFISPSSFDLPAELVDHCTHWLNLSTGCLEIRRAPEIWFKRPSDWEIDVRGRTATRKNVRLVDPQSFEFALVAQSLQHFELPQKVTVYQPLAPKGRLSVELRHLELSFRVNNKNLLECRQLNMEIDPNQDAGTWYGLESKIVLRNVKSQERSIIVPLSESDYSYSRQGMHVAVYINGANDYGKYKIDDILGRLTCPQEPRLLYTKALYHALTSFCLPDPLTGRTGTEEAFSILRSGASQPWTPLGHLTHVVLKALETLPPRREYYPKGMKRFQRVTWNKDLTVTVQHDGLTEAVRDIVTRSNQLNDFANDSVGSFAYADLIHLRSRGESQRRLYERPTLDPAIINVPSAIYHPRDRQATSRAAHVYEIVRLIVTGCPYLDIYSSIMSFLESAETIGGFHGDVGSLDIREPLINQIEGPISAKWGSLIEFCRDAYDYAPLIFRLGLLAFRPDADLDIILLLVAFSTVPELEDLSPPSYSGFVDFKSRGRPSIDTLRTLIAPGYREFAPIRHSVEGRDRAGLNAQEYDDLYSDESLSLANHIREQWPVPVDHLMICEAKTIDISLVSDDLHAEWETRRANDQLKSFVEQIQEILSTLGGTPTSPSIRQWTDAVPAFFGPDRSQMIPPTSRDLVINAVPLLEQPQPAIPSDTGHPASNDGSLISPAKQNIVEAAELKSILKSFASSANGMRQQYAEDLLRSLAALEHMGLPVVNMPTPVMKEVGDAIKRARDTAMLNLLKIRDALASDDYPFGWLRLGSLWPSTSPLEVLALLRSAASHRYGPGMKEALVQYGLAITHIQRLERIRRSLLLNDKRALREELQNPGHENWEPLASPDWLLLEIDGGFLIRAEQVDVARAMIAPKSGQNSVLQMNMGKGKTSCIVPMVIATLANGQNLARLIVPKALLMQTAQTMQSRLGGLVGRGVLHVPFSRKTPSTVEMLKLYAKLHRDTRDQWGLILTSHDNVLSYKLGGWQHLAEGKIEAAKTMTEFQGWLDDHCRDILDECDFTLAVKTQLNYPSGPETAIDGHPFRWQVAQDLLAMAAYHVSHLQEKFPDGIEVIERGQSGSFPIVHILNNAVEDAIHDRIVDDICAGRTTLLRPVASNSRHLQQATRHVLCERNFDEQQFIQAVGAFANPQASSKILLVARGLLLNRILFLCLSKRWNVQYGLHPKRAPVAVPFEAKGKPSEQSEFGHPDVAIIFTCLAFYYAGLTAEQFRQGLQSILQSEDPATQYEMWTSSCRSLPEILYHWNVVNVDDEGQVEELRRHLCLDQTVINHFLNHFVFPIHAKQFEIKLQASAWDLPLYSQVDRHSARTTGFSGTNDNRAMLPLTIRQDDLPSLKQTSAEVLSYLLQERNRFYEVTVDAAGRRQSERVLLERLCQREIRVFIDAGAYILEMDNAKLAQEWLKIDTQASAAVYFGNDNRAWVHYRGDKNDMPLLASRFADNLSECVVYLDEAHTRGVDLKLPQHARGALTLALKQTKDFTMQGKYCITIPAMRLRQLQTTQSVTFFAPPDVDQSIKDFCHPTVGERLDSSHVIAWLLEQTCHVNEDLQSLYVAQGLDFCRRTDAVWRHGRHITDAMHRTRLLDVLQQPERQTLEELYGGASTSSGSGSTDSLSYPQLLAFADKLRMRGVDGGTLEVGALEEVEQERDVQVQVEKVRQVQKAPRHDALVFPGLHLDISDFVRTGSLGHAPPDPDQNAGFEHAFAHVARTSIGKRFGVRPTGSRLFVSTEFGRTAQRKGTKQSPLDNFLRPVEWILWSPSTQTALVVIPEEAELLIPRLRRAADKSPVHLVAYAAPVTKAMLCFNDFRYYSLPPLAPTHELPAWFRFEIGLLGGRLHVHAAEWDALASQLQSPLAGDAVKPEPADGAGATVAVADDPAAFAIEWLTLLRKTQDVLQTPMGYICTGRRPPEGHPFLASS